MKSEISRRSLGRGPNRIMGQLRCQFSKGVLAFVERNAMTAGSPEHVIELLDKAFNQGYLEAVLGYYEDASVVIPKPGTEDRGIEELRSLYHEVYEPGISAKQ